MGPEILSQLFGSSSMSDAIAHSSSAAFPSQSTGGRNQYVELERFETEEQFQMWLQGQGRKWGIVQKGRVTIEDVIDQYACVYRRRKGYACRVQMRVRHNRRSGHKVVEVLPLAHDHNFYGHAMGGNGCYGPADSLADDSDEFGVAALQSMLPPSMVAMGGDFPSAADQQQQQRQMTACATDEQLKQEELDFSQLSALMNQQQTTSEYGGGGLVADDEEAEQSLQHHHQRQQQQQPMDMLWSNILSTPAIQQFAAANGELLDLEHHHHHQQEEEGGEEDNDAFGRRHQEQQQREENENDLAGMEHQHQREQQGQRESLDAGQMEMLAETVAEKVTGYLATQFEPKFEAILSALECLSRNVEELRRSSSAKQHHQEHATASSTTTNGVKAPNGGGGILSAAFRHSNNNMTANLSPQQRRNGGMQQNQAKTPTLLQNHMQQQQRRHIAADVKNAFSKSASSSSSTSIGKQRRQSLSAKNSIERVAAAAAATTSAAIKATKQQQQNQRQQQLGCWPYRMNKFGMGLCVNSPMKSARKSVHAYRQRRRELSYRFMKEVGVSLTIDGTTKSIFHWRATEIAAACQAKREELAEAGQQVFYRGREITDQLYRVDCSRDLVNGRRCGQMIADSLWPRGFFQRRMLMPILNGVSHRAKKRVDGSARTPVQADQFEVFKVALLLLGGFLMEESERSKWMETAREGVNQRGLDELANSKRAHYDYAGGPLFGNCQEEEDAAALLEQKQWNNDGGGGSEATAIASALLANLRSSAAVRVKKEVAAEGEEEEEDDELLEEEEGEEENAQYYGGEGEEEEEMQ